MSKKKTKKGNKVAEETVEELVSRLMEHPIVEEAERAVRDYIAETSEEAPPEYELRVIWVASSGDYWRVYFGISIDDNTRYLVTHPDNESGLEIEVIDDGPTATKEI